jgi:hypothetical protein
MRIHLVVVIGSLYMKLENEENSSDPQWLE